MVKTVTGIEERATTYYVEFEDMTGGLYSRTTNGMWVNERDQEIVTGPVADELERALRRGLGIQRQ